MSKLIIKTYWLATFLVLLTPLFFIDVFNHTSSPTQQYIWNLGHIVFFSLVTIAVGNIRAFQKSRDIFYYLIGILIVSFVLETLQIFFSRSFSFIDILRNLTGCIISLTFIARQYLPTLSIAPGILFLIIDITGFAITGWIDYQTQQKAPIIEDFESTILLNRWTGNIKQSRENVKSGNYSGKVIFEKGKYPGINLSSLPGNWSSYKTFEISVYNPSQNIHQLTVRLDDVLHAKSLPMRYDDRFNRVFKISPGWNQLIIPLLDIKFATMDREMDLDKMFRLIIFMSDVEKNQLLYLDNLTLTSKLNFSPIQPAKNDTVLK